MVLFITLAPTLGSVLPKALQGFVEGVLTIPQTDFQNDTVKHTWGPMFWTVRVKRLNRRASLQAGQRPDASGSIPVKYT